MKSILKPLTTCLILITTISSMAKINSSEKDSVRLYELTAGKTVMKISSNGGRIISFKQDGREFITQPTEHEIFGSTLWTAPQSDWGWPPYEILDNQEYEVKRDKNLLKMISKPDPISGFQMEKSWQVVDDKSIKIEYLIRNVSDTAKSVGAWEVTRVPCGGIAFFPDGGEGKLPKSNLNPDIQKDGIDWVSIDKKPIDVSVKMFSNASEGWLAYENSGLLFIKQFPDVKPENYAPEHGEIEIYVNMEKSYIELENHGEYKLLKPGESLSYLVNWFLIPIPTKLKIETGNNELADFVRQQIILKN